MSSSTRLFCCCCPRVFTSAAEMHACTPCGHVVCFDCAATMVDSRCPRCSIKAILLQPKLDEADAADVVDEDESSRLALRQLQDEIEEMEALNQGLDMELKHMKEKKSIRALAAKNAAAEAKAKFHRREVQVEAEVDNEVLLKHLFKIEGKTLPTFLVPVSDSKARNRNYVLGGIKRAGAICKKRCEEARRRVVSVQKEKDDYQKEMEGYNKAFKHLLHHCRENFSVAELQNINELYETSNQLLKKRRQPIRL